MKGSLSSAVPPLMNSTYRAVSMEAGKCSVPLVRTKVSPSRERQFKAKKQKGKGVILMSVVIKLTQALLSARTLLVHFINLSDGHGTSVFLATSVSRFAPSPEVTNTESLVSRNWKQAEPHAEPALR